MQRQIDSIKNDIAKFYQNKIEENLKVDQQMYKLQTLVQDQNATISNLENEMSKLRREVQSLKPPDAKTYEVKVQNTDRKNMYYNQTAEQWVPIENSRRQ